MTVLRLTGVACNGNFGLNFSNSIIEGPLSAACNRSDQEISCYFRNMAAPSAFKSIIGSSPHVFKLYIVTFFMYLLLS